ncbi:MAG: hypothetical protein EXS14_06545 [Planctomycetes bacterium]|nr:hypothetical protein [Planctomycetota bacterium]
MATTTLLDPRIRIAHLVVPLSARSELAAHAKAGLEFASRCASRVTLLYLTEPTLKSLDSAMRCLAIAVGSGCAGEAAVKLVVRHGDTVAAVRAVLEKDPGFVWANADESLQLHFDCVEG